MSYICGNIFVLAMVSSSSSSQLMFQLWKFIIEACILSHLLKIEFLEIIYDASYKHVFCHNVAFLGNTSCMPIALDMSTPCIMKTCFFIYYVAFFGKIHDTLKPGIYALNLVKMVYSLKDTSYMELGFTSLKHVIFSHVYSLKESLFMEMHHTRI